MNDGPLVTIGLPVYNGDSHLAEALQSLLAQDYPNVEVHVSDNASTDETQSICTSLAATHPQLRYVRNPVNVGPIRNFNLALERARGKYFMWAAHDDRWNHSYVSRLVEQLDAHPAAVLATPAILHMNEDGALRNESPDRPAPGTSSVLNFRRLLDDHAPSWIYGLWNTAWLRRYLCELDAYPLWGGDVLWLADVALREKIVGSQEALLYKRLRRSRYAPQNSREQVVFWAYMTWHLTRICNRRIPRFTPRVAAVCTSWHYVYRLHIRRSNPLRTAWRVVRISAFAAVEWLFSLVGGAYRQLRPQPKANAAASRQEILPLDAPQGAQPPAEQQPSRRSA